MLCDNAFHLLYYGNKDGERVMSGLIREICGLSILCGAVCSIIPEGNVKRVTGILCSCVLIITVLTPLRELDFDYYAQLMTKYHEREAAIYESGDKLRDRLNRAVIEDEYAAYITDKAETLGIIGVKADVEVRWSSDGVWVPYSAKIDVDAGTREKRNLEDKLLSELGIPSERVAWINSG